MNPECHGVVTLNSTFGIKSVPEPFHCVYRWGCRLFLFGVAMSLCLLLSKHDFGW